MCVIVLVGLWIFCCFFFFKQKTAYEMRISDWSSDVCSSDLAWRRAFPLESSAIDYFRATWSKVSTNRQLRQSQARVPGNAGPLNSSNLVHRSLSKIGRASNRERVCQYV